MDNNEMAITRNEYSASLENGGRLLYSEISNLIEHNRRTMLSQVSSATVFLFWRIGKLINGDILKNQRADYGKKIVSTLSTQLKEREC